MRKLTVIHLVATDISACQGDALAVLCAEPGPLHHALVQTGHGPRHIGSQPPAIRIRSPLPYPGLQAMTARRALRRSGLLDTGDDVIFHAWSMTAARGLGRLQAERPLLIEVESARELRDAVRWRDASATVFICSSIAVQRRLAAHGISPPRTVLVRRYAEAPATSREARNLLRSRVQLGSDDFVISVLPPVTRQTGSIFAAWAAMLLEKVHPEVRLIVPGNGREGQRTHRLAESCRHAWLLRDAPPNWTLRELLAVADLNAYLPSADGPVTTLGWAMASGCPLMATDVPAVTELLAPGRNAWLCRPNDPKDTARRMLQALEAPEQSRRQAECARAEAAELFGRDRMVAQYRELYERVGVGREV